ncbi:MAG: hypothetical protein H6662_16090 [Ardenticatenaceae bacterium]|nr:hypothetical protein [Ardenticatenaceae bacterium]
MWNEPSFAFQDELESGERIVWSGRPQQGIIFRSFDKFVIVFILFGLGTSIAWIYGILSNDIPKFLLIFMVLGIAQMLFMGVGSFLKDLQIRKNLSYALTNKRIIITSNSNAPKIRSLNLQSVSDMSLTQHHNKTGTILFGSAPANTYWIVSTSLHVFNQNMPPSFDMIDDAKMVFDLIRKTQQALST